MQEDDMFLYSVYIDDNTIIFYKPLNYKVWTSSYHLWFSWTVSLYLLTQI